MILARRVAGVPRTKRCRIFFAICSLLFAVVVFAVFPASPANTSVIRNIRFWSTADYTRVIVDIDKETKFTQGRLSNPDRFFLDISGATLSSDLLNKILSVEDGILKQVRAGQNRPTSVRIVLDIVELGSISVSEMQDPCRLVIDLYRKGVVAPRAESTEQEAPPFSEPGQKQSPLKAGTEKEPEAPVKNDSTAKPSSTEKLPPAPAIQRQSPKTSEGDRTLTRMLGLKVTRIVIDPGHGGHDFGTTGPGGLHEKDLVLSLARDLQAMIQAKIGAEVILTRSDDKFVSLEERTAAANQHKADLFVSIHANSSRNRSISGVETYYLDFARTDAEREIAARENATSASNLSDLEDLIKKIAQADKSSESRELASLLQKRLYSGARQVFPSTKNRGVRSAPFIVLIGANMPSVLAEVAFISNAKDERLLKKEATRQRLVRALFSGIEGYMETLGGNIVQNRTTSSQSK